jgi:hypothetical protein
MRHCINCKYISTPFAALHNDPEMDSVCNHPKAKIGDPSIVMGRQDTKSCLTMRRVGPCGIEAIYYDEKPMDKVDE